MEATQQEREQSFRAEIENLGRESQTRIDELERDNEQRRQEHESQIQYQHE